MNYYKAETPDARIKVMLLLPTDEDLPLDCDDDFLKIVQLAEAILIVEDEKIVKSAINVEKIKNNNEAEINERGRQIVVSSHAKQVVVIKMEDEEVWGFYEAVISDQIFVEVKPSNFDTVGMLELFKS